MNHPPLPEEMEGKTNPEELPSSPLLSPPLYSPPLYKEGETETIPANEALEALSLTVSENREEVLTLVPIVQKPLDQNPAAVYLAGLSAGSRRTMRTSLNTISAMLAHQEKADALTLDWSQLRFSHTAAVRSLLAERYSHATANKMLAALRGTLKAAWRLGQMSAEDYARACDVPSVIGETLPAGRAVASGELVGLMKACAREEKNERLLTGARDAAILGLLYGCGLRRAEVVTLDVADFEPGTETGMGSLKVLGKRNKARRVPVVGGAAEALSDWLALRGSEAGPLFVRIRKGGKRTPERLTTQAIYYLLEKRAGEAGLTASCSPHDMRRSFIGDLLDAGADIATVQKLAGHANVTTTARYDRRGEATRRKAASLLHVPYFKGKSGSPTPTGEAVTGDEHKETD